MKNLKLLGLVGLISLSSSCFGNRLTAAEIRDAVIGVQLMGEARQAVDDVVEISTSFALGDAAEAIVDAVRAFAESQAPCSTVTPSVDPPVNGLLRSSPS